MAEQRFLLPDCGQRISSSYAPLEFVKYGIDSAELHSLSSWDDGVRTLMDMNTGLTWEVKSHNPDDLNACQRTYSWNEALTDYPKALNDACYAGFNDWRLPNKNELRSIIDYNRVSPALDQLYFPDCPIGFYWSSDTYMMQPYFGWAIFTGYGSGIAISKESMRYVMAVRGGYDRRFGSNDDSHFVDNGDGTVTDAVSGLMWQQSENPRMTWQEAMESCSAMSLAGYTDWRLPNIKELNTILNLAYTDGWWYYKRFFPAEGLQPPLLHYFSSTTFEETFAWVTNFCFGYDGYYANKNSTLLFRAVRNTMPGKASSIICDASGHTLNNSKQDHRIFVLPESGQRDDYDDEGNIIKQPQIGEPFYGQDGRHISAKMSFAKLNEHGCLLSSEFGWNEGVRSIQDVNTGLVWEVKAPGEAANGASSRYTWEDAQAYVNELNHLHYGGFADWRLPNREELRSIVSYADNIPAIDQQHFPYILPEFYWSCNSYGADLQLAWGIYFGFGCAISYKKTLEFPVIAVRGGYAQAFGDCSTEHFLDNGDGTVSDTVCGLQWKQDESPLLSFAEALAYCESLSLAGHNDWRLPNIKEIATLIDPEYRDQSWHHPAFFPNVITKPQGFYLASTTYASTFAWGVNFQFGYDGYYADKKHGLYPFRPVRTLKEKQV